MLNNEPNNVPQEAPVKLLGFWQALIPLLLGIGCVLGGVLGLGMDAQVPLLIGTVVTCLFGIAYGHRLEDMIAHMLKAISDSMGGILILLFIGSLMGAWIACGSVPYIIYIGLKIISPQWFLLTACIMCAILSAFTGTSWSTVGTLGIAFMGIGYGLGIPPAMTAGAVVSGSWFGDKQSPLSDTTNFAPIIAGTTLYKHMYSMLFTTTPALLIALIVYAVIGIQFKATVLDTAVIDSIRSGLESAFILNPLLLIPPLLMIVLVVKKVDPFVTLISASLFGVIFAIIIQGSSFTSALTSLHYGFTSNTGVAEVDKLLSRGGLNGMMWTVSVLMLAIPFGAALEKIGVFEALISRLMTKIKTAGGVVTTALLTDMALIYGAGELFTAMLITGRSYAKSFDEKGLDRAVLSRTMEDGGTMFSPLCPWNPNGVVVTGALGVATFAYAPYAIMNLATPIFAIVFAFMGIGMLKAGYDEFKKGEPKTFFSERRAMLKQKD
jgi:NhaC family Na+:H+ antiporter